MMLAWFLRFTSWPTLRINGESGIPEGKSSLPARNALKSIPTGTVTIFPSAIPSPCRYSAALLLLAGLIAACAGRAGRISPAPAWVESGAGALPDPGQGALYGIGSAEPNITNVPLSKVTARERARVSLAFAVQDEVRRLVPAPGAEKLIRPVVEAVLPEHQVEDVYLAPDGTRYALARLPEAALVRALESALADPKIAPPEAAGELRRLLQHNLAARGLAPSD